MKNSLPIILSIGFFASTSFAHEGPCKEKAEAKHAARKALHSCLDSWAQDSKVGSTDPTDDCSGKLSSFVAAAKEVKACRVEHHSEKAKK